MVKILEKTGLNLDLSQNSKLVYSGLGGLDILFIDVLDLIGKCFDELQHDIGLFVFYGFIVMSFGIV